MRFLPKEISVQHIFTYVTTYKGAFYNHQDLVQKYRGNHLRLKLQVKSYQY